LLKIGCLTAILRDHCEFSAFPAVLNGRISLKALWMFKVIVHSKLAITRILGNGESFQVFTAGYAAVAQRTQGKLQTSTGGSASFGLIESGNRGTITPCDSTPFGVAGIRSAHPPFHGRLFTFYPFGVGRILNLSITNVLHGDFSIP
jgi:hypothetical protein